MSNTNATACSRCGGTIAAGAKFCSVCGYDVSGQQASLATEQMSAPPSMPTRSMIGASFAMTEQLDHLRQATLGEYEVYGELGRGGMATVYLAHDLALDRKVAIKVMSPALVQGEGMVERFKREARTAASLSHPNIIPVYAVRETDRILYFVMKFVQGRPLDSIIKEVGKLPVPMVQAILSQVGSAFGYAHRRGIVHRDIKPANIMIDDEGWAVVTDFGIAKVSESQGLTMTGMTVGTPTYMSPEQCMAQEVTGASDQYSLGVVSYEMITGRPPFTGASMMAIMYGHFNDIPADIGTLRPDCPQELKDAVMRMLAKEPAQRWPTVEEAVAGIGAKPMSHDDPTRTEMVALAKVGASLQLKVSTPSSPIPLGRKPTKPTAAASPSSAARSQFRTAGVVASPPPKANRQLLMAGGVLGVAAVAALLIVAPWKPKPAPVTSAPPPVVDTTSHSPTTAVPAPVQHPDTQPATSTTTSPPPTTTQKAPVTPTKPPPQQKSPVTPSITPPNVSTQNDEMFNALQNSAADSRRKAVGEGATAADLTQGDSQAKQAVTLYGQGKTTEAAQLLSQASQAYGQAATKARDRAIAESAAAAKPPVTTQAPPVTPVAPAVDDKKLVEQVILDYGRTLESGDLTAIKRANPGIPSRAEGGLKALFDDGGRIKTNWTVSAIEVSGDGAHALVTGTNTITFRGGKSQQVPVSNAAKLERASGSWRIVSVQ